MVSFLYKGLIQLYTEHDSKLLRLRTFISPYLAYFIKHDKTEYIIFSPFYLSATT